MPDPLKSLIDFVLLARCSEERGQMLPRDKFLILAGGAACGAGYLDVAAICRELVLSRNPRHLLGNYDDMPSALRNTDFQAFFQQLSRFCPPERAEFLLNKMQIQRPEPADPSAWAQVALLLEDSSADEQA